jgi:RND family efflux transporter MFP subunit
MRPVLLLLASAVALSAQPQPPSVRVTAPAPAAAASTYTIPGRTEPLESARVFSRATGIVKERAFDIGDLVKAGDTLAVIDVPDLDRAVDAARATLEQAEVRAANASTLAGRSTNLLTARVISQEESDQRTSDSAASAAAVRVAKADLARLEETQKFATVRAPFDAVVAARNFDRGDRVRGDASTAEGWLFHLARIDTLRFVIGATPDLALRLNAEAKAVVTFNEFPGRTWPASVARSSRVFDTTSGTMRVELLLQNDGLTLPAGLTGTAAFQLAPPPGTWIVPANTLILRGGKSTLAIVKDGKVAFLDVLTGRNLGATIEVTSAALAADTRVIINPNALLKAGDTVTVAAK